MNSRKVKKIIVQFLRDAFFNSNPANGFNNPNPWRKELAQKIAEEMLSLEKWEKLFKWALIENLNTGSYFRATCPIQMRGSGRWLARDGGGRYRILRDLIINSLKEVFRKEEMDIGEENIELYGLMVAAGLNPSEDFLENIKNVCEAYLRYAEEKEKEKEINEIKKMFLENKDKMITKEDAKRFACGTGVEEFIKKYELKEQMTLGEIAEHPRFNEMISEERFLYVIRNLLKRNILREKE